MEAHTLLDPYNSMDYSLDGLNFHSLSSESYSPYPASNFTPTSCTTHHHHHFTSMPMETVPNETRPAKQLKTTDSWNSCTTTTQISTKHANSSSSSSCLISFDNSKTLLPTTSEQYYGLDDSTAAAVNPKREVGIISDDRNTTHVFPTLVSRSSYGAQNNKSASTKCEQGTKRAGPMCRSPVHAQDHVLAERKRREKLSQRFIALSALVPGLKKVLIMPSWIFASLLLCVCVLSNVKNIYSIIFNLLFV